MSVNEIDRVKEDIEVIKEAAGLELPFGWEDVWLSVYLIPVGVWLAIWRFLPFQLSRIWRILPVTVIFRTYPNNTVVMRPSEKFEAKTAGTKSPQV